MIVGVALLWEKDEHFMTPDKLGVEGIKLLRVYNIDDDSGLQYIVVFAVELEKYPQCLVEYVEFLDEFWKTDWYYPVKATEFEWR
ncbi:hypothetical protein [Geoglobus acetivorans]|uniref:hypothetical protein n=1 Tax=Geoglobus acetivorans TaxID=565033 RepID=UPI00064F156A